MSKSLVITHTYPGTISHTKHFSISAIDENDERLDIVIFSVNGTEEMKKLLANKY